MQTHVVGSSPSSQLKHNDMCTDWLGSSTIQLFCHLQRIWLGKPPNQVWRSSYEQPMPKNSLNDFSKSITPGVDKGDASILSKNGQFWNASFLLLMMVEGRFTWSRGKFMKAVFQMVLIPLHKCISTREVHLTKDFLITETEAGTLIWVRELQSSNEFSMILRPPRRQTSANVYNRKMSYHVLWQTKESRSVAATSTHSILKFQKAFTQLYLLQWFTTGECPVNHYLYSWWYGKVCKGTALHPENGLQPFWKIEFSQHSATIECITFSERREMCTCRKDLQPWKDGPNYSTPSERWTSADDKHPSNALNLSLLMVNGIVTKVNDAHPLNAPTIFQRPSNNWMSSNDVHPLKTLHPSSTTFEGIVMCFNPVKPANGPSSQSFNTLPSKYTSPAVLTLEGMQMLIIAVLSWKALMMSDV